MIPSPGIEGVRSLLVLSPVVVVCTNVDILTGACGVIRELCVVLTAVPLHQELRLDKLRKS